MTNVGVILPDLAGPFAAPVIAGTNALAKVGEGCPVVFYESPSEHVAPLWAPAFHVSSLWGYAHPVVATGLSTARRALTAQGPPLRALYLWDLEWARPVGRWYRPLLDVYANPAIVVVPASADLAWAYERAWNRRAAQVVEEFDLVAILESARRY